MVVYSIQAAVYATKSTYKSGISYTFIVLRLGTRFVFANATNN